MPLIMPCSICSRGFQAHQLYWVKVEPPDYIDLPEDGKHVDPGEEDDEPVVRVHYCGDCIGETELPPLESAPDGDQTPEPYAPGGGV